METLCLNLVPSHAAGHIFTWTVNPAFKATEHLDFWIQWGAAQDGPWEDLSPKLTDQYLWQGDPVVMPKDPVQFYRLKMVTAGYPEPLYSPMRAPYGDLGRREFLLVAEIMRKELLQMQQLAGVPGLIWVKSVFGPGCTKCRDPITGDVLKQDCSDCFGTGRTPGYHGPYCTWLTLSPHQRNKHMQNDKTTTREQYSHQARMLGTPRVKKDDILVDVQQDKRYYVDTIQDLTEIRRIPVVQNVLINEIPSSSPVYKLGV